MCYSENKGTERVLECPGPVKSATMMVPTPWILGAVEYAKSKNLTNIGVHLALTSEWVRYRWRPISASYLQNSTLVDKETFMWRTSLEVERHASREHVHAEVHAQLQRAFEWGIELSHFDSHMGSLYGQETGRLELVAIALSNAYEFGLPLRLPYIDALKPFRDEGFAILDHLIYNTRAPSEPAEHKEFYRRLLLALKPGVTEMYIHPAIETDEIKQITNSWRQRNSDMLTFCDPEIIELIRREGIIVIDFNPLKKWQREKMRWRTGLRASDVVQKYRTWLGVNKN